MSGIDPTPDDRAPGSDGAFRLLSEGVQRQLWRMGWRSLHDVQVKSIHAVLESDKHLIIAAETAGGKTEAAFLPVLSVIGGEPTGSVRVLYVGPLKALINDQFSRVEELCGYLEMPVHRWHGDVGASQKEKVVASPGGVLLITPESIESLFINRTSALARLFAGLRFIVVDELHAFLGTDRGLHLQSLLCRLQQLRASLNAPPARIIALSATVGDFGSARRYLDADDPNRVEVIRDQGPAKEIRYRIHSYPMDPPVSGQADDPAVTAAAERLIAADIVEQFRGKAGLIFANAKQAVEVYADLANELAREDGLPESFLVHHGSLAKEIREDTETAMKGGRNLTTFCSSTLELGIDIGSVTAVGQLGPTWSVASLIQRLGRSGRKEGQPRVMRVYIEGEPTVPDSDILDPLQLDLVQSIALTELMLERWVEPPVMTSLDLSTLAHQIMSVLAQTGGMRADALFDRLCSRGAFRLVDPPLFTRLLRQLGKREVVEQMPEGDLILGLLGEKLRKHKAFYAVFPTPEEFRILHDGKAIGTLPLDGVPMVDDHLLFAARRWQVVSVDQDRLEIRVVPARGRKAPVFRGGAGEVHTRVHKNMLEVLSANSAYAYLDEAGQTLIESARSYARIIGADQPAILATSENSCVWLPWIGTRAQAVLVAMLRAIEIEARSWSVSIQAPLPRHDFLCALAALRTSPPSFEALAPHLAAGCRRKYDWLLTEEMRVLDYTDTMQPEASGGSLAFDLQQALMEAAATGSRAG